MKEKRTQAVLLAGLLLAGCVAMGLVEGVLRPPYLVKSAVKAAAFLACMALACLVGRNAGPFGTLRAGDGRSVRLAVLLAGAVIAAILTGYALLAPVLDLSAITENLGAKEGITARTFPLVALYISVVNSLLEELFFRGFGYLTLRRYVGNRAAGLGSAVLFALYHVLIMDGWFSPALFFLLTAALALAGGLFNWLDRRGSILPSWLVHMAANLAINLIGMRLFGILGNL